MNRKYWFSTLVVALALWVCGCNRQERASAPPAPSIATATNATLGERQQMAGTAKTTTQQAVAETVQRTQAPVASVNAKAQALIDTAQRLVAAGKYRDALAALRQAAGSKLAPEQQKKVEILRLQIQQGMTK